LPPGLAFSSGSSALWFFGFTDRRRVVPDVAIAQWNGQQPAFRFYLTILAVLIFVMQKDE
jgi:predicted small integral membrane protein